MRLRIHPQLEPAAGDEVAVVDLQRMERSPVEGGLADIDLPGTVAVGDDGEISAGETETDPVENRTGDLVDGIARAGRMESGRRQDVPCGHLPAILIAADSFHGVGIGVPADGPGPFLGLGGSAERIEQEWYEMHRLVRMVVILVPAEIQRRVFEELFQFRQGLFLAAQELKEAVRIVRDEPALLERVAFDTSVPFSRASGFRSRNPFPVGGPWPEPADRRRPSFHTELSRPHLPAPQPSG